MGQFTIFDTAQLHSDYHATLAQMRRETPVYLIPEVGAYYITRHNDVRQVLSSPGDFSSTAVRKLLYSGALSGGMPDYGGLSRALVEVDQVIGSDPPEHSRLRNHINKPFMPRRIKAFEENVSDIFSKLLDEALASDKDTIDIVDELAVPGTLNSLSMFLGVEPEYYSAFRAWTLAFIRGISGKISSDEFNRNSREMTDYLWSLVEARRKDPRADVITDIVAAQQEDPLFTDKDVIVTLHMLLGAGHETTTNLIGNTTRLLCLHPDQYQKLRNDRSLLPTTLMESLRYDSPVSMQVRLATRDVEISDVKIPEGSLIMVGIGSANLDEEVIEDPERFDITREYGNTIPFGYGIHFCVGSALAKLEGQAAFTHIMDRFETLEPVEEPVVWHDSLIFRGPESFHIRKPRS